VVNVTAPLPDSAQPRGIGILPVNFYFLLSTYNFLGGIAAALLFTSSTFTCSRRGTRRAAPVGFPIQY